MRFKWENTATLVPKIYRDNYDAAAEEFLGVYCPEALTRPMAVPIFDIARAKMGMTVIDTERLSKDTDVLGMIAFFDGELPVYDSSLDDCLGLAVRGKTVLIDPGVKPDGRINNTMAHECVHWHYHRNYFTRLHKKQSDEIAFRCPKKRIEYDDENALPELVWMEAQARGIAPRILMPKEMTRAKAREIMEKHGYSVDMQCRIPELHAIADELAGFFKVSKVAAKRRLVDLRLISEADGNQVYNYNDDAFVMGEDDRRLTASSRARSLTRQLDFAELYVEYNENVRFRELMQSGLFGYVDGYVVINDNKYIKHQSEQPLLTEYAQGHLSECSLVFERRMDYSPISTSLNFMLASKAFSQCGVRSQFCSTAQNDATIELANRARADYEAKLAEKRATTKTLWEFIEELKALKGIRNDSHLADKSHLNSADISRMKNGSTGRQSLEKMLAVCVGLDLELETAKRLLALAGLVLPNDERGAAYETILTTLKGYPMDIRNDILQELDVEPLGSKSKE
jgi:hypothetical protein